MNDHEAMVRAMDAAAQARIVAHPNPWVGCVILTPSGRAVVGATRAPGEAHAEIVALEAAGPDAVGATAVVTLEPCSHHGRTGPCTDALIEAGVRRVVIGVVDPDPQVSGAGVAALEAAGIDVTVGVEAAAVEAQLTAYLHQRRTGRPYVVCKLAATLDGRTAAPDGTSQWITGLEARTDGHRLRAESDAVIVGAGTVRVDDPSLTVRHVDGPDPERIVLGDVAPDARVQPCRSVTGDGGDADIGELMETLGSEGMIQVLIEGGAGVAHGAHAAGVVDRYVIYLAPALLGGDDGRGVFAGPGATTIDNMWRGEIDSITQLGQDVRIDVVPGAASPGMESSADGL